MCGRPPASAVARRATRAAANRARASACSMFTPAGPARSPRVRSVPVELQVEPVVAVGVGDPARPDLAVAPGRLGDRARAERRRLALEVLARDQFPDTPVEPFIPWIDVLGRRLGELLDPLCHSGLLRYVWAVGPRYRPWSRPSGRPAPRPPR